MSLTHKSFLDNIWDKGEEAYAYADWLQENGMPLFGELIALKNKTLQTYTERARIEELEKGAQREDLLKELGIETDPNKDPESALSILFDERGLPVIEMSGGTSRERFDADYETALSLMRMPDEWQDVSNMTISEVERRALFRSIKFKGINLNNSIVNRLFAAVGNSIHQGPRNPNDDDDSGIYDVRELRCLELDNVLMMPSVWTSLISDREYLDEQELVNLKKFKGRVFPGVNDALNNLARLTKLDEISLDTPDFISSFAVMAFTNFVEGTASKDKIKKVSLRSTTGMDLRNIWQLKNLEELDLNLPEYEIPTQETSDEPNKLRILKLQQNPVISLVGGAEELHDFDEEDLAFIKDLKELKEIHVGRNFHVNADFVEALADNCPELKVLNFHGASISPYLEISLEPLTKLERVDFGGTQFSCIEALKPLQKLKFVNLSGKTINSLEPLTGKPELRELDLSTTSIESEELRHLASSKHLISLNLFFSINIDNAAVKHIVAIGDELRYLNIAGTVINNNGLIELARARNLNPKMTIVTDHRIEKLSDLRDRLGIEIPDEPEKAPSVPSDRGDSDGPPTPQKRWVVDNERQRRSSSPIELKNTERGRRGKGEPSIF